MQSFDVIKTDNIVRRLRLCLMATSLLFATTTLTTPLAAENENMGANAIDEGQFIEINSRQYWVVLRGRDVTNPVLFVISGPGVGLSAIAPFFATWEADFTLLHWDQPGSGATHSVSPEARDSLTLDSLTKDGIEIVEFVRQRLGVEKIAVLGISAGSMVGLKMMHARPEYFSAYIGTGQFINWAEQDALGYSMLLEKAREEGDRDAEIALTEIGPPPYETVASDVIKSNYHSALTAAEMAEFPVFSGLMAEALGNPPPDTNYLAEGVALENPRTLATAAYELMRDELMAFDAFALPLGFAMPVFFIQGDEDYYSVNSVVQAYTEAISAPAKRLIILENASHSVFWLREPFLEALNRYVRPQLVD